MATKKELTGGTGDVNPQFLTATVTQSAADISTTLEFALPVPRFSAKSGRSLVMEILRVNYVVGDLVAPAGQISVIGFLATSESAVALSDPTIFSFFARDGLFATAVGFSYGSRKYTDNLNDGAGHGFLVATDQLFLTAQTVATGAANVIVAKLYYRFKEVSLQEYIGIVQGQQ